MRGLRWGVLLFALSGAAGAQETKAPAAVARSITLPAGEFHEECMDLAARQPLEYSFRSARPVEFNIHYHRDNKIHYPVQKKKVIELWGIYTPQRNDGYCLMWRNPQKRAVALDYRFNLADKK